MKKETYAKKLFEMFGVEAEEEHLERYKSADEVKKKNLQGGGIKEEEIQHFRAAQGMLYFLQAPELFSSKICKHCGEGFLVSRQQVSLCSYTCIEKELEKLGIIWTRKGKYEAMVPDVWENNEPIWIKNIDVIRKLIDSVSTPELV